MLLIGKGNVRLVFGILLGIMVGWALGYLRLPYLEKNYAFTLGFVGALAFVALMRLVFGAFSTSGKRTKWFWLGLVVLGIGLLGFAFNQERVFLYQKQNDQAARISEMVAQAESLRQNDHGPLLRLILNDIADELKNNAKRTLSDTLLERIEVTSLAFTPYRYVEQDSLSVYPASPERGQLLQALLLMSIAPETFAEIKKRTVFAGADMRGADLKGLDLSGANLNAAYLEGADLSGTILSGADLSKSNLWGAKLNKANLDSANLSFADLSWAQLNEATLVKANMTGAKLIEAQLIKANLFGANMQWTRLCGAFLIEANLTGVDFVGANFDKSHLIRANFYGTDLRKASLSETDMTGILLQKAVVDNNWLEKLKQWQPTGGTDISSDYTIVNDTFNKFKVPMYRLFPNK